MHFPFVVCAGSCALRHMWQAMPSYSCAQPGYIDLRLTVPWHMSGIAIQRRKIYFATWLVPSSDSALLVLILEPITLELKLFDSLMWDFIWGCS